MRSKLVVTVIAILSSFIWSIPSFASNSFYHGKVLNIVVPFSAGGGHDQWARMIAPYMKKYLDLKQVKVEDEPGGGGLIATNDVYSRKPNGLSIELASPGAIFAQIFQMPGVKFDMTRFSILGSIAYNPYVFLARASGPYQSFSDLINSKRKVIALATGKAAASYQITNVVLTAFNVPHKMVTGFKGEHGVVATFQSGDGDMFGSTAPHLRDLGSVVTPVLFVSNRAYKGYYHVPTVLDVLKRKNINLGEKKAAALRSLANLMFSDIEVIAPPGVPQARMRALEKALKQTVNTPSLKKIAEKGNHTPRYTSGRKLRKAIDNMLKYKKTFQELNASSD